MRYTYVRQHDTTDCAAACLAMVCLHYKKEVTITRLRDMMGTDLKGTNLVGLQKAANELGFTTAAVRVDRENFLSDFSLPCIAQVITDQGLAHFVVVFKKTTIKDDGARRKHMLQDAESRKEEEEKGKNIIVWVLAVLGAVAAVAGIAYAVYRFFTPDYLEEFEDDFDDDFDDYFSEDDQV